MNIADLDINILAICIGAVIGLGGIALAIFLGLRSFNRGVGKQLGDINGKLVKIETTADNALALIRQLFTPKVPGTVVRQLTNFGKVSITAEPGGDFTEYRIEVERGTISDALVSRLTKQTGFEDNVEKKLLSGRVSMTFSITPQLLRMVVPSTNAKICTEYISRFLKWLDTEYKEEKDLVSEYEDDIKI